MQIQCNRSKNTITCEEELWVRVKSYHLMWFVCNLHQRVHFLKYIDGKVFLIGWWTLIFYLINVFDCYHIHIVKLFEHLEIGSIWENM